MPESILKNGYNSLPRGSSSQPGPQGPDSFRLESSQTIIISVLQPEVWDLRLPKLGGNAFTELLYTIVGLLVFINQYII